MDNKFLCDKSQCTLCMACVNKCPRNAIELLLDEQGYEYLVINQDKCISCGACGRVCGLRNDVKLRMPVAAYAAQLRDKNKLKHSASGGAFQAIAETVLNNGGVCYGCHGWYEDGLFQSKHIRVDNLSDLPLILNSKYVVSRIGESYRLVRRDLENNKIVLFSGTPCQAAGLKAYLNKEYKNLYIVDIICHGVTSRTMFNDYLLSIAELDNVEIERYDFRDKSICWGSNYQYTYKTNTGKKVVRHCPREESSFSANYLNCTIIRENCYACKLSSIKRVSDLTLGDFWGIEKTYPEFTTCKVDKMSVKQGISCVLVNSDKGLLLLNDIDDLLILKETALEAVVEYNKNLRHSSKRNPDRARVLKTYRDSGYITIEKEHRERIKNKRILYRIKNYAKSFVPDWVRIKMYQIFVK